MNQDQALVFVILVGKKPRSCSSDDDEKHVVTRKDRNKEMCTARYFSV